MSHTTQKTNINNLRSLGQSNGIGQKKIKMSSSHSQVSTGKKHGGSGGKDFATKPPMYKKPRGSQPYTDEGKKASTASIKAQKVAIKSNPSTGGVKNP